MTIVYVDPSELKSSSKFAKCIGDFPIQPLPGLEERTGADSMIGFAGMPAPTNDALLGLHIKAGALLVQVKFDFDLIASIIDGRYKASQEKMHSIGAQWDQCILLFIAQVFEARDHNEFMINGQYASDIVPAAKNFTFGHYVEQRMMWAKRGGIFENIVMEHKVNDWLIAAGNTIKKCRNEPVKEVWEPRQKLALVSDWRNLLVNLPGISQKRAMLLYNALEVKSWYGFVAALMDDSLLDVSGIGLGTIEKIKRYLKNEK